VIVFSNTTPLIALASVDALHLLPARFQRVHVAESVAGRRDGVRPLHVAHRAGSQCRGAAWQVDLATGRKPAKGKASHMFAQLPAPPATAATRNGLTPFGRPASGGTPADAYIIAMSR
jgi:hypothetical protein